MAPERQVVWMPGGVRTEIHLTGADTDGAFCLLVDEPPAGWSLRAHIHTDAAETIHVLDGAGAGAGTSSAACDRPAAPTEIAGPSAVPVVAWNRHLKPTQEEGS